MKKNIFLVFVFIAFVFASCEKSYVEQSNDDYDWNTIVPEVAATGATTTYASGLAPVAYKTTTIRGGSTYAWKVEGSGATVDVDADKTYLADITFDQSAVAISGVKVIVIETTHAGVTASDTVSVDLLPFCPQTIDWFVGTWTGTEVESKSIPVTVVFEKVDETTIRAKTSAGYPPFLQDLYTGWGETFQAGHGLDGNVLINVGLATGALGLDNETYWGQTLPGPYDYWYSGEGSWDGCGSSIVVDFTMHWSTSFGENGACITTLTKVK